ncbi:extracellular guanyl-specific ribonuclease Fl2 [Fusarium beomiforme]|uniref:Extracellular guanyl-specific ribonuclease Fl2 n=1 Tax=Fusarium beomiforme TaxID=44412 RepID=A0A9P5APU6_9HYPO|nr:extracellular guanyl-specific ribonuclease Fl2 [Fusarium beomiforme]
MPSLADLGEMDHMKRSEDDMDDNSSTCSYYSLPDVEDPWLTQIPAHEVRRQIGHVPEYSPRAKYPHPFRNSEALPLKVAGPWMEYPLCLNGRYSSQREPGPARVIINPSVPGGHDVIYHPKKKEGKFAQAKYRSKGYRARLTGCMPMATLPSPPSSPTFSSSPLYLSPPSSPGLYPATSYYGLSHISQEQAFAIAAQQQQILLQQQSLMASCTYQQTVGVNGLIRGQFLLQYPSMGQSYIPSMSGYGYY